VAKAKKREWAENQSQNGYSENLIRFCESGSKLRMSHLVTHRLTQILPGPAAIFEATAISCAPRFRL
jgi:hypothetical protein